MSALIGGVEAGGTKFVCAIGSGPGEIVAQERLPTTTPTETLARVVEFFVAQAQKGRRVGAVGVGSFGPLDPDSRSSTFGYITATPKPGWSHTDIVGPLKRELGVPVAFDTDVNAAALGEGTWGAATDVEDFLYLTIGTGIGGGGMINGRLMHGLIHPEMGHIRIPHDRTRDPYPGHCPFHGNCLEGLASGPAMADRWGQPSGELPDDHACWDLEAEYLALAVANFICTLSPERIILGGGVMQQAALFPMIRTKVAGYLNGYIDSSAITRDIDRFLVPPALGDDAGVLGSIALGQRLLTG